MVPLSVEDSADQVDGKCATSELWVYKSIYKAKRHDGDEVFEVVAMESLCDVKEVPVRKGSLLDVLPIAIIRVAHRRIVVAYLSLMEVAHHQLGEVRTQ